MGEQVAALHQLVAPFGKTDPASVLLEVIQYIKFLHGQINVLSTPSQENKQCSDTQSQQSDDKNKDQDGPIQDLRSRGLCLVPIFIAGPAIIDFWRPPFEVNNSDKFEKLEI